MRPEHLKPTGDAVAPLAGIVTVAEWVGEACYAYMEVVGAREGLVVARLDADSGVRPGDALRLLATPERVHVFDSAGEALERPGA